MQLDPEEEKLLRSVTLQNAQAVFRARERSERELREANQRVASILESITDGFVAFDLDWKIIYINGRAKEMIRPLFGRGENMLGRNHWEAFPESLGTPIEENYRRAVREQKTVHFEVFYPPLNAWYEIRAYPSQLGLSVYFQDITQRRRSAEALGEQREWLAVTLRSIGDGVIATDLRGNVTFLNPVAENMTGWKNEEAIGRPLGEVFKLVNEQTLAPAEAPIHKVLREKRVVGLANHTALIARNGTSTAIEDSAAPILNAEGNITGAVMVFHDVTERRRTDAALRGSEERFAALVRASAQAVWVADASGEVAEYSPTWSAFTGQTFEEMKGWGRLNVIHSEDHAGLKKEWAKAIATRSPIEVDYRLWHVSGEWRWTTMRAVPLLDEAGAIRCWVAMNTDVTERRAAEQRLRESENRKSAILNAALDAIITMDHHGKISDFNPAAEKIFGYSQFEAVGQPLDMLIIPERLRERHRAGMKHYLATGEGPVLGRRIEMPALRKGGSEFPVELSISRIPDIEPPMFTATLRDISQRKRMENSLRDTAERAHATFNQAAVGIAIASLDGRFLELNQKFAEITGYSIEDLLTKTPLDITHPEDRASTADSMRKVVHGELPHYVMEKRYVRKDGEIVWILSTITVVRDADGVPQRFVGVIEDITQRRQAEEDLRLSRERLHLALTAGGLGDWEWEAGTDLVTLGPRAAEIFGINAELITWTGLRGLLHEEDREVARVAVETALANHSDYNIEYRVLRPGGEVVWVAARGRGRYAADGTVLGMSGVVADITERRRAEEVRFRLAAVVESSDDAIISMDLNATITTWNKGAERTFGYTAAEIVGKPIMVLLPPDRENEEPAILERLKHGERIEHYETVRVRKDGTFIDVSLSVSPVFEANGRIIGVSKISRDITARKHAEERLRRSEEELRALANSIPQLAWMAEPDGNIFWYNQRWYDYTGSTPERMQGWGWQSVHDPKTLPLVVERWKHSLHTGEPFDMEFPLRGADGVLRWFLTRVSPMRDSQGHITRWFGTNTDVDTVRRAQEALREETRVLELLNDTGTAIAAQLDLQKVVQIVTDAATKLCGAKFGAFFYNVIDAQGEAFLLYALSGAPREAFEKFGHPRATPLFGPTFCGEGVIRSDDVLKDPRYGQMPPYHGMPKGHLPVRSYLAVPVISRNGEVIGGLFFGHPEPGVFTERSERIISGVAAQAAIAIDNARLYEAAQREIVERKRVADELREAQEKLSHHAEDLEKQVTARTASLTEALSQLEEFSYSVSHDLRAPLRAISGYNRILEADFGNLLPPKAHEYLNKIARSTLRMERLVNDVLTMSRVARSEIHLHPISLQQFIEEIVEQHPSMQAPAADLAINAPHTVLADDASLNQAIANLLSNAVKFIADGKPVVRVRSEKVADRIRVWIEDQGIGIPPQHRGKLFGMFQRLPVNLRFEGTGIGLAIVRKAVERMGGTVGMESNDPCGSRFWIELPGAP